VQSHEISPSLRGFITAGAILAMLMQILDTTIANVALPHMQATLGATRETVSWVLTSYIVASAIAIPITGWLADRIGRRPLFIWSVIAFTAASMLCALAQNLPQMVVFRAMQGVAGAFLVPLAQAVMLDINPRERHGRAMAVFGAGVMIGPILGPVLGGWLTDSFNWRWVFLVNLPVGAIAALLMIRFLPKTERTRRRFDLTGFFFLAMMLAALQMMLDRGEQLDWFNSWEIWLECGLAISGAWMFGVHMLTSPEPIFDPAIFADRNFITALIVMTFLGFIMLAGLALLPTMLQGLFGYSVLQSGYLTAPRGVGTLLAMVVAGRLTSQFDPRLVMLAGLSGIGLSFWMMSGFSLEMDQQPVISSSVIQGFSIGCLFVPLNTVAFRTMPGRFRTTAASLFNLSRSIGGSVGISIVTVLLARNQQISHSDLAAHITPYTLPPISPAITQGAPPATETVLAMLDAEINRQAAMIAYIDDFYLMMIIALGAIPLLLLIRKGAEAGKEQVMVMD
jgi:DHA2 family multidrug resistance protein